MQIPESHVRQRLEEALTIYADAVVPGASNAELWREHHLRVLDASNLVTGGFLVGVFANQNPGIEIARFMIGVTARKLPSPTSIPRDQQELPDMSQQSDFTINGKHIVDVQLPPVLCDNCGAAASSIGHGGNFCHDHTPDGVCDYCGSLTFSDRVCCEALISGNSLSEPLSPEIVGTWGPVRVDGVLNYGRTPVPGDIFTGPDGTEWRVKVALNPSNKDEVTLESLSDGRVFTSKPPEGWSTPVTFKRGNRGSAISLLASELGAVVVKQVAR